MASVKKVHEAPTWEINQFGGIVGLWIVDCGWLWDDYGKGKEVLGLVLACSNRSPLKSSQGTTKIRRVLTT